MMKYLNNRIVIKNDLKLSVAVRCGKFSKAFGHCLRAKSVKP